VIEQRPNKGKGAALRLGFERVLADGVDAVLTLDADGQHDPAEIPKFVAAFEVEPRPDLVIGQRRPAALPMSSAAGRSRGPSASRFPTTSRAIG
jgi:glycosyltransferase involved in cell wall biosynthesis